ncbi:hypothetical protein BaRGS_00033717 [Batillaria attramentaria]|uniref:TMEM248/TMEM219 domain-containing protein n=1 Tax=Batillaria attramentaria TaxID=370345 RepID=A0ABD0JK69_9CAEN
MAFALAENVRGFFLSRPPLVVFMICLGSFAVVLITFAYIIKVKDIKNPDITEDWNDFLDRLSSVHYCLANTRGEISNATQAAPADPKLYHALDSVPGKVHGMIGADRDQLGSGPTAPTPTTTTAASSERFANISVLIDVELHALPSLVKLATSNNFTSISTVLQGHQIGLTDSRRNLDANITLVLPPFGNQTTACQHGPRCYMVTACATITAPASFFPRTKRPDVDEVCEKDPEGWNNRLHLELTPDWRQCRNASFLHLVHQYDPTLTVMLTMDRSVINLHLMHTSYFLFVMMVTLFCYAIIKGRPTKVKVVYTQCSSDKVSMQ